MQMEEICLPRQGGWDRGFQWSWDGLVPGTGADAKATLVLQANAGSGSLRFTFFLTEKARPSLCATGLAQLSSSRLGLGAVSVGQKGARWGEDETVFVHSRLDPAGLDDVFEKFGVLADILMEEDVFTLFSEPSGTRLALKVRGLLPNVLFAKSERRALGGATSTIVAEGGTKTSKPEGGLKGRQGRGL